MERAPVPEPVKRPIVPPLVKNLEFKIGLLLTATVTLAQGTMSKMEPTVDLLTTALRAFDLQAGESSRAVSETMSQGRSKLASSKRVSSTHQGESSVSPDRTCCTKSRQSTHRVSETSSGLGEGCWPVTPTMTGQNSFSTIPFFSAQYR